ncbi:DcaP family trimeric outer membrane transporter [Haliangium sp.]|uniref:DcaP family trimeric outer membrane transporter n=1 Tax=Haliangium sp. TaxID=2663208 RepID=UPI003D149100
MFTQAKRSSLLLSAALSAAVLLALPLSGTARADDGGTTYQWGGYIKLDGNYSTSSSGNASNLTDYVIVPGAIPVPASDTNQNFNLTARESRFWFKTTTPTEHGDLGTHIELDFYGFDANLGNERTSNPSSPRLRHAYATWRGFLVGQGWSTWMDLKALPEKNDFGSPAGRVFARQAMIRYTHPIEGVGELQVAIENPESTVTAPDGSRIVPSDDIMPDTVVKFETGGEWGHVAAAGIVRAIRAEGVLPTAVLAADTQLGFGGRLSGKLMVGGKHNLRFAFTGGRGIGRYVAFNGYNDGEIDDAGQIELINVIAALVSGQVWLSDDLRINLAVSASQALNNSDTLGGSNKQIFTNHTNVMWSASPAVRLALEHIYVRRTLESDADGDLHRIQASARYTF